MDNDKLRHELDLTEMQNKQFRKREESIMKQFYDKENSLQSELSYRHSQNSQYSQSRSIVEAPTTHKDKVSYILSY